MSQLTAKQILKNKFWIVEKGGEKIATIQAIDEGGFAYVTGQQRLRYPSIKMLSSECNVVFDNVSTRLPKLEQEEYDVYGYPVSNKPYNVLWDVKHQFPVYTKTTKSKSYFCAGYYLIKFNNGWVRAYCPKFITLNRYPYQGPYKTKLEAAEQMRIANGN